MARQNALRHGVGLAIATLGLISASSAQNLLDMDMRTWSTRVGNPAITYITKTSTRITWGPRKDNQPRDWAACSYRFRAKASGRHVLWVDGYGGATGVEPFTFDIYELDAKGNRTRSILKDTWVQLYNDRDVGQWTVALVESRGYDFEVRSNTSNLKIDVNYLFGAKLEKKSLPVVVPLKLNRWQQTPWVQLAFRSDYGYSKPFYMLFASASRFDRPIWLPFGDLYLTQPTLLLTSTKMTYSPPSLPAADVLYQIFLSGTYWQVVEFDTTRPSTTLRLGDVTQTKRRIR